MNFSNSISKLFLFVWLLTVPVFALGTQPNPALTPGELCTPSNPNFVEYRYPSHVAYCKRAVTIAEKFQIAQAYGGIPRSQWHNYEFDHLIPLSAGGDSSTKNVWPEPIMEAHQKDKVEYQIYRELADGTINQAQAVTIMMTWVKQH